MDRAGSRTLVARLLDLCDQPASRDAVPLRELALVVTWRALEAERSSWSGGEPERPRASFTGPGTQGFGAVTLTLDGAPPGGTAFFLYGPLDAWGAELDLGIHGLPWVSGLPAVALTLVPEAFALDAAGSVAIALAHNSGLTDWLAVQALCVTASGEPVGLSSPAVL